MHEPSEVVTNFFKFTILWLALLVHIGYITYPFDRLCLLYDTLGKI